MHIPSACTQQLTLLSFAEALERSGRGDEYDASRWLYVPDFYTEYRYILGTRGDHPLICIGVNPSTAIPGRLDNTLKSVERIARFNGYDSFLMFNVYAQRATLPGDMDPELNPLLHAENLKAFAWALSRQAEKPAVWAAWGAVIETRRYLPRCVLDLAETGRAFGAEWFTAGPRSRAGHPHHPLYLKKDSVLEPFSDLIPYLEGLTR